MDYTQIVQKIKEIVAEQLHRKVEEITDTATLESLGADSLDRVELIMKMEEAFNIEISDEAAEKLNTIDDAAKYIMSLKK